VAQAIPLVELQAFWSEPAIPLRERVFAAMAYDTAARASELLGLNIQDLDRPNKQAVASGSRGAPRRRPATVRHVNGHEVALVRSGAQFVDETL
jgi:integrase